MNGGACQERDAVAQESGAGARGSGAVVLGNVVVGWGNAAGERGNASGEGQESGAVLGLPAPVRPSAISRSVWKSEYVTCPAPLLVQCTPKPNLPAHRQLSLSIPHHTVHTWSSPPVVSDCFAVL